MSLIKYNRNLPNNFFRFFDDHATQSLFNNGEQMPAVNIVETDDAFKLEVLAPGREKENFSVELNDDTLTVAYEAEAQETPKIRRREFTIGNFKRVFQFDAKVINGEAIEATYTNGILALTLPKFEEAQAKGPQKIAIA